MKLNTRDEMITMQAVRQPWALLEESLSTKVEYNINGPSN